VLHRRLLRRIQISQDGIVDHGVIGSLEVSVQLSALSGRLRRERKTVPGKRPTGTPWRRCSLNAPRRRAGGAKARRGRRAVLPTRRFAGRQRDGIIDQSAEGKNTKTQNARKEEAGTPRERIPRPASRWSALPHVHPAPRGR
jgi:hypothetical protein